MSSDELEGRLQALEYVVSLMMASAIDNSPDPSAALTQVSERIRLDTECIVAACTEDDRSRARAIAFAAYAQNIGNNVAALVLRGRPKG